MNTQRACRLDEDLDDARRLMRELQAALRPHLLRIGLSGMGGRLAEAATGALLYLSELTPALAEGEQRKLFSSTLGCVVEFATVLELMQFRDLLPAQDYHRMRILAIRCTHLISPLADSHLALLRLTRPALRVLRPAS